MYTARQQNLGTAGVDVMLKYVDITVKIITVTQSLPKHTKSRLPLLEHHRKNYHGDSILAKTY